MGKASPTKQTMDWLRAQGCFVGVCERFIPPGIRKDLWGLFDLEAIHPTEGIVHVQCCATQHIQDHVHKWLANDLLLPFLRARGTAWMAAWRTVRKNDPRFVLLKARVGVREGRTFLQVYEDRREE